jgi:hypothetical protein
VLAVALDAGAGEAQEGIREVWKRLERALVFQD